jgi:P-type conjugative transfer protein TrbJ
MRRAFILSALATFLWLALAPLPASAFGKIVFDPEAFTRLGLELDTARSQLGVLTQQLAAIKALDPSQYQWSNAQQVINSLGQEMQQTQGLAYNASNMDQQFKSDFPGYVAPQNYGQQYQNNAATTLNTLNGVLQNLGMTASDFQNETTRMAFLQNQAQSAQGQTQAIQASSQIASELLSQVQLMHQTLIAQTNAQDAYYANQVQSDASAKAELQKVVQAGSTTVPPYGTSGHYLNPPHF